MKNHEQLEFKIAKLLRFGVVLSALFMLVAIIFNFNSNTNTLMIFETYDRIPLKDFLILHYYRKHWITLIAYFGLAILITLPIIRVLLTAFLFIKQKDYKLALLASFVFLALILSFILGIEL